MYYIHRALVVFALLALTIAGWWSIRAARADAAFRQRTPGAVARAIELEPENGEYLAALALQAEYTGQDSAPLLEEIARLNPRASAPRIRMGLAAEQQGDEKQAEHWLQEAFSVDHQFEPRWTLANFYFRQGRREEFWTWMKSALEISYGDRGAAFDLCWQMSDDGQEILERAIPNRREVAASYLVYVLDHRRPAYIAGAAGKLVQLRTADDLPVLYGATDALLGAGQAREAADLWQALGNPRPEGITHLDFENPRIGHGFDWRSTDVPGVTHQSLDSPTGHRIRFSGRQAESCELLVQVVGGLRPGIAYTLRWEARSQGIVSPTGLAWTIAGTKGDLVASDDWSQGGLTFTSSSDHATLVLTYRRPEGQVRTEGSVDLRRVVTSLRE